MLRAIILRTLRALTTHHRRPTPLGVLRHTWAWEHHLWGVAKVTQYGDGSLGVRFSMERQETILKYDDQTHNLTIWPRRREEASQLPSQRVTNLLQNMGLDLDTLHHYHQDLEVSRRGASNGEK